MKFFLFTLSVFVLLVANAAPAAQDPSIDRLLSKLPAPEKFVDPAINDPLAKQMVASVTELLRPAGVVFAMFHSKKPEGFQRYRVADSNTLQRISTAVIFPAQKVYQNREIQDLFGRYRTMKSFVSRDQLRETLFIK